MEAMDNGSSPVLVCSSSINSLGFVDGERVIPSLNSHWWQNLKIVSSEDEETLKVMDKFDELIGKINNYASRSMTLGEVRQIISSFVRDGRVVHTCDSFDAIFCSLQANLRWYDVEKLNNICNKLDLNNIEVLDVLKKQYRVDLEQYLENRLVSGPILPNKADSYKILIDGAWDRKELRDPQKCQETCRKIMVILGKCTKETKMHTSFEGSKLHIGIVHE